MSLKYVKQCTVCGKAFFSPQRRGMYCGNVCKDRAYRGMRLTEKTCPVCGTLFKSFGIKQRYCSVRCRTEAKRARRGVSDKLCVICGKPLPRRPGGGHKTCSEKCSRINRNMKKKRWGQMHRERIREARALLPLVMHDGVCPICGKAFTSARMKTYCSADCKRKAKDRRRKVRTLYVHACCRECGREFRSMRKDQRFCSKSCSLRWQHTLGIAPKKGGRKPYVTIQETWGYDAADGNDNMIYGNMIAI